MKKIHYKILLAFLGLFFLVFCTSGYGLKNAYDTFKANREMESESIEAAQKLFRFEDMTLELFVLGQKHIFSKDEKRMEELNQEIKLIKTELNKIIKEIALTIKDDQDEFTYFTAKWENFWNYYEMATHYSHLNRLEESQKWLIQAGKEFDELNTLYLIPLSEQFNSLFSELLDKQNASYQRYLWVGAILFNISIFGFFVTFYYLLCLLKKMRKMEQRLEFLAFHDELTELPNRRLFEETVRNAFKEGSQNFSLMFLDMDELKYINDNYGHDVGDLVIKAFAEKITECVRDIGVVARQGGDEFTVYLKGMNGDEAIVVAKNIINSLREPIEIRSATFEITTSIGIASYPRNGVEYGTLLKNADYALYQAKQLRNTYVLCDLTSF